jgi:ATP-binding cassette subfamily F protein uup
LLDRLADYVLGFDGKGNCQRFADFRQWLEELKSTKNLENQAKSQSFQKTNQTKSKKKITLGEKLELEKIENVILGAEGELELCQQRLADDSIQSNPELLAEYCTKLEAAQDRVDALYRRWQELEEK